MTLQVQQQFEIWFASYEQKLYFDTQCMALPIAKVPNKHNCVSWFDYYIMILLLLYHNMMKCIISSIWRCSPRWEWHFCPSHASVCVFGRLHWDQSWWLYRLWWAQNHWWCSLFGPWLSKHLPLTDLRCSSLWSPAWLVLILGRWIVHFMIVYIV